jgi:hypothetical protein
MTNLLSGKSDLVTGGSRGVSAATVRRLTKEEALSPSPVGRKGGNPGRPNRSRRSEGAGDQGGSADSRAMQHAVTESIQERSR